MTRQDELRAMVTAAMAMLSDRSDAAYCISDTARHAKLVADERLCNVAATIATELADALDREAAKDAEIARVQREAYIQGVRNSAETLRSMKATDGVIHQPTMNMAVTVLEDIAARAALEAKP